MIHDQPVSGFALFFVMFLLNSFFLFRSIFFYLQDIVTESSSFDLVSFIPLLRDRIYTANPFAKQFLVSWVSAFTSVQLFKKIFFLLVNFFVVYMFVL